MRYRDLLEAPYNAAPKLKTPASTEPVSFADVQAQCRLDANTEQAYIGTLIQAAREEAEAFTNRQFLTATWELYLDAFPCDSEIELPRSPLQSVTSVEYRDSADAWQTLSASTYEVQRAGHLDHPGRIALKSGSAWPTISTLPGSVRITFVAGHTDALSVPARAKKAILHEVAESFERRELGVVGSIYTPTRTFQHLLGPLRMR